MDIEAHYVPILGQWFELHRLPLDDLGNIDTESRVITIAEDNPEPASTELHEILHGILRVSGWCEVLADGQEEGIVIALENGLFQAGYRRLGS